ncbi:hypothetical protein PATA110616_20880 [Paenibacillus tarimensis]
MGQKKFDITFTEQVTLRTWRYRDTTSVVLY